MRRFGSIKYGLCVATAACLLLSACDDGDYVMRSDCSEYNYIKLDNYLFKLPKNNVGFSVSYNGEQASEDSRCFSSPEKPIVSDEFSFMHTIEVPGYDKTYEAQFIVQNKLVGYIRNKIDEGLKQQGKTIADLSMKGTFYKFPLSEKYDTAFYISTDKKLKDINGHQMILTDCGPEKNHPDLNFVTCIPGFEWRPGIRVHVREIGTYKNDVPIIQDIDVWNDIFPIYLNILDGVLVDKNKNGGKK